MRDPSCRACRIPYRAPHKGFPDLFHLNDRAFLFLVDYAGSNFRFNVNDVTAEAYKVEELGQNAAEINWDGVLNRAVRGGIVRWESIRMGHLTSLVFKGPDPEQLDKTFYDTREPDDGSEEVDWTDHPSR